MTKNDEETSCAMLSKIMAIPFVRSDEVNKAISKLKKDGKAYKSSNLNEFTTFIKTEFSEYGRILSIIDTDEKRLNNVAKICLERLQKKIRNTKDLWKMLGNKL